jgi:hypothetical protein
MKSFKVMALNFDSVIHLEILASDGTINWFMGGKHKIHPVTCYESTDGK